MSICYVTAFLDIKRENWATFSRTFDDYFKSFSPHIDMFRKLEQNNSYHLVVFIDKKHHQRVSEYVGDLKNVTLIDIDEEYLQKHSILWQRLGRETEIMQSDFYKSLVAHRLRFPENNNPRYTLINHTKIDFINIAAQTVLHDYFCWVDFGYFGKVENIPANPLDLKLLQKDRVNYTLINPISLEDSDCLYTLRYAPEKIGGFFFFGSREAVREYQKLYHIVHKVYQNMGIVDDDQHLALQCCFVQPELFALHSVGGWHKALVAFQIK